jgi:hypothetical protein
MYPTRGSDDEKLNALLQAYASACPTPEVSANFMPDLWRRIESRQSYTFSFRRMASALVTTALALSLALGVMSLRRVNPNSYSQSYIEALAEANTLETPEIVGQVGVEISEPGR